VKKEGDKNTARAGFEKSTPIKAGLTRVWKLHGSTGKNQKIQTVKFIARGVSPANKPPGTKKGNIKTLPGEC